MTLGYSHPLYVLAFDHRGSFQSKLLGITGTPTDEQVEHIREAKQVIYAGFLEAYEAQSDRDGLGVLMDEQFGADVARAAHELGVAFAMPVEKSGQNEFDFEYGEQFGEHILEFDPTFSKVLVRMNVEGDREMNKRQTERLARLGDWLHEHDRKYLFELLVPAEQHQLDQVGGDADRYDRELRAGLMVDAILELYAGGVDPDIWKIEGLDTADDCDRVARASRTGGRDGVRCIVLGRGGNEQKVIEWLQTGAVTTGYSGFAVGRTIWWDALTAWLSDGDAATAATTIAANYTRLLDAYRAAVR
jgi:myo-inositol catabolism protein IolC